MGKTTVTMKMDNSLHDEPKRFCADKGYLIGAFVEKAVKEKLEIEEVAEDMADYAGFKGDKKKLMIDYSAVKKKLR